MSGPVRKRVIAEVAEASEELLKSRANRKKFRDAVLEVLETAELSGNDEDRLVAGNILNAWEEAHPNQRMDDLVEFQNKPIPDKVKIREWTIDLIMLILNRGRRTKQPTVEKVGGWHTVSQLAKTVQSAAASGDAQIVNAFVQDIDLRCMQQYEQMRGIWKSTKRLREAREALVQQVRGADSLYLQTPLLLAAVDEAFESVNQSLVEGETDE